MVFVDDGSKDNSYRVLSEIYEHDRRVNVVRLRRNFGQTPALKAGFDFARGEVVISMDGDLQHDPEEIPRFLEKIEEGYDLVSGWRANRKDHWLMRRLPSRIANWMMAKLSGIELHDFGTTFKAYRKEILQEIQLYGELHRFIPALASSTGARIAEVPISNPDAAMANRTTASAARFVCFSISSWSSSCWIIPLARCNFLACWVWPARGPGFSAASWRKKCSSTDIMRSTARYCCFPSRSLSAAFSLFRWDCLARSAHGPTTNRRKADLRVARSKESSQGTRRHRRTCAPFRQVRALTLPRTPSAKYKHP